MNLARETYAQTEEFPPSETFGLRMQMRRSAVAVASHIAEGHGRLNDLELRKCLGTARGALNEMQTQTELANSLGFLKQESAARILEVATETAKLINGLLASLQT